MSATTLPALHETEQQATALRLARALDRVARLGLSRPLCLVRSLALHRLLERRGIHGSHLRIGVRRRDALLEAHAWIEWNGMVLGDDQVRVTAYHPLDDLAVAAQWTQHAAQASN